jgi:nucleotide-binding universal stress UspA family protein
MFERIMVPLDGSQLAERALPYAAELAQKYHGQLFLLMAVTPSTEILREMATETAVTAPELLTDIAHQRFETESDAAHAYLGRIKAHSTPADLDTRMLVVEGTPEHVILHEAQEANVSLIVMATHGRSGLGRLVNGSVADAVLRQSEIPVLLIRPQHDKK